MISKESVTKEELILLEFWRRTTQEDWLLIPNTTRNKIKQPFTPFSSGKYNKTTGVQGMDAESILLSLTPHEQFVMKILKDNRVNILISKTNNVKLNQKDMNKFSKGYKKLREKDVIRRVKRQMYMYNPRFISVENHEDAIAIYDKLK